MKNKIEIYDYEADFFCPMCGAKVVDSVTRKIQACEHLQYASFSEAPGMPEHIVEGLIGGATTSCNERENVERLKQSLPNLKSRFIGVQIAEKNLNAQVFFRHCGFKWFRSARVPASGDQSYFMRYMATTKML